MRHPDLYMSTEPVRLLSVEEKRAAIEHIVKVAARYGHDMARLGAEAPDLTIEWTEEGRIKVTNRALRRRRWWQW